MSTPLIQTNALLLIFGAVVVADHIDFSFTAGERLLEDKKQKEGA